MGLRALFGPSREEMWRLLSAELDGRYVDGGLWRPDKVQISHDEWTITLDTFHVSTGKTAVRFTRMRAPYVNPEGFRFMVYRRGVFSDVAKFFGMQDVQVGHEPFDSDFIIQGTHEERLRTLFDNARIRSLIERQPSIQLAVKDDEGWFGARFPQGVDELYFAVLGVITDVDRLKLLYELFGETLDQLLRMGSAEKSAPGVGL